MQTRGRADTETRMLRWAAASALIGLLLVYNAADSSSDQRTPKAAATVPAPAPPTRAAAAPAPPQGVGPALPRSPARHLEIPALGVSAPFMELTLGSSGQLNAPPSDDNNLVGWYRGGPSPGERGNAIVAGHVDTRTGPAVFWPLSAIKTGNKVVITRDDGIVATFTVDRVATFAKDDFPDEQVYGDTTDAQLRLITCGGSYNRTVRDYTANVVVFAHLASFRWA
ncbi:class F sortase [Streptomyces sp. B1866]|nr:class F sortase [Streptomyces sp. B1866]